MSWFTSLSNHSGIFGRQTAASANAAIQIIVVRFITFVLSLLLALIIFSFTSFPNLSRIESSCLRFLFPVSVSFSFPIESSFTSSFRLRIVSVLKFFPFTSSSKKNSFSSHSRFVLSSPFFYPLFAVALVVGAPIVTLFRSPLGVF